MTQCKAQTITTNRRCQHRSVLQGFCIIHYFKNKLNKKEQEQKEEQK